MSPVAPGSLDPAESEFLRRAAERSDHRSLADLTPETLRAITNAEGIDFATALLFDRFTKSPAHSSFIQRINQLLQSPAPGRLKLDGRIVIIPGALYVEHPEMGGDGHVVREVAAEFDSECSTIPIASVGSVQGNAALIREWLEKQEDERTILVSLSKGGPDLKLAMTAPEASRLFRNVVAWVNVCGPLQGTPMANWILDDPIRRTCFRLKFWLQRRDFAFITSLRRGPGTPLDVPLQPPSHTTVISVIGFPLRRHMSAKLSRRCHQTLAPLGPNDGTTLLADLKSVPGNIYPAWGMDHYFRPASEARGLIRGVLRYLAEISLPAIR